MQNPVIGGRIGRLCLNEKTFNLRWKHAFALQIWRYVFQIVEKSHMTSMHLRNLQILDWNVVFFPITCIVPREFDSQVLCPWATAAIATSYLSLHSHFVSISFMPKFQVLYKTEVDIKSLIFSQSQKVLSSPFWCFHILRGFAISF